MASGATLSAHTPTHNFKTTLRHRKLGYLLRLKRRRAPGNRSTSETIVLDVAPGVTPSDRPPVRIFVGTEPEQFRAERVFVWSILKHRNPARRYEIHLMKDLVGFNRDKWKTGFTCYRYGIPTFAGGTGRAIYNDVDQIYLADPAELFDIEMHGKGQLGIDERESSVMLLDCERMSRIWPYADAQRGEKHKHFRAAVHSAGLWGPLPGIWNARDGEYVAGESKLLHFTTLQTQPWRPFPDQLRYRPHPLSDLWHALEREADAAGFTVFTKERPSRRFAELLAFNRVLHEHGVGSQGKTSANTFSGKSLRDHIAPIAALVHASRARSILDYGSGKGRAYEAFPGESADSRFKTLRAWEGVKVTCYDPGYAPFAGTVEPQYDGVVCTDVLEHVADDDVPWVLDELFRHARAFVYAVAACYRARKVLPNGENAHVTVKPATWWREQMEIASRRHGGVEWVLCVQRWRRKSPLHRSRFFRGGAR